MRKNGDGTVFPDKQRQTQHSEDVTVGQAKPIPPKVTAKDKGDPQELSHLDS